MRLIESLTAPTTSSIVGMYFVNSSDLTIKGIYLVNWTSSGNVVTKISSNYDLSELGIDTPISTDYISFYKTASNILKRITFANFFILLGDLFAPITKYRESTVTSDADATTKVLPLEFKIANNEILSCTTALDGTSTFVLDTPISGKTNIWFLSILIGGVVPTLNFTMPAGFTADIAGGVPIPAINKKCQYSFMKTSPTVISVTFKQF